MSVEIYRSLDEAQGRFGPCALAIGNFDGVHVGHKKLIGEAVECAAANNLTPAVLTFDPHPAAVIAPDRAPLLICPLEERFRLIGSLGVKRIFVLNFTLEIARLRPDQFVSQILVSGLDTKAVFVGNNFRFGHKQSGTPEILQSLGRAHRFITRFIEPVASRGKIVSSTAVRLELMASNVAKAGRLLGRCYSLTGPVVSGRGIGAKKTVPTLNLRPASNLLVPHGIFITETFETQTGRHWHSVTSAGYNPTFGATDLTVETFLLDPLEGSTPANIEVHFRHFLRREQKYPDAETLKAQILKDVARAAEYWRRTGKLGEMASSIY